MQNYNQVLEQLTPTEKRILRDLEMLGAETGIVITGQRPLAQAAGCARSTVQLAIERLNALDLIQTFTPPRPQPSEHKLIRERSTTVREGNGPDQPRRVVDPLRIRTAQGRQA